MGRRLVIIAEVAGPDVSSGLIEGRSLYRLARLLGLENANEVHRRYDAMNLLPAPDPLKPNGRRTITHAASEMLPSLVGVPVILLGQRVACAFGVMTRPSCEWREVVVNVGTRAPTRLLYATVPHPSTVNRTFNDRAMHGVITSFLRKTRDEEADGSLYVRADAAAEEYARSLGRGEIAEWLTVLDVATHLGIPERTVEDLARLRRIGHMSARGGLRFRWEHVRAYEAAYEVPMAEVVRRRGDDEWGPHHVERVVRECAPGGTLRRSA